MLLTPCRQPRKQHQYREHYLHNVINGTATVGNIIPRGVSILATHFKRSKEATYNMRYT